MEIEIIKAHVEEGNGSQGWYYQGRIPRGRGGGGEENWFFTMKGSWLKIFKKRKEYSSVLLDQNISSWKSQDTFLDVKAYQIFINKGVHDKFS